jgi:hypothetical protein
MFAYGVVKVEEFFTQLIADETRALIDFMFEGETSMDWQPEDPAVIPQSFNFQYIWDKDAKLPTAQPTARDDMAE